MARINDENENGRVNCARFLFCLAALGLSAEFWFALFEEGVEAFAGVGAGLGEGCLQAFDKEAVGAAHVVDAGNALNDHLVDQCRIRGDVLRQFACFDERFTFADQIMGKANALAFFA